MYHVIFIHSSVDGHLGCLHVLAIVNSAFVNIGVRVSLNYSWTIFLITFAVTQSALFYILITIWFRKIEGTFY